MSQGQDKNLLFPIFLKLERYRVLVIGGGNVALEKLTALTQNTEGVTITVIAEKFNDEVLSLIKQHDNLFIVEKKYETSDLDNIDILISAINDRTTSERIAAEAKQRGILTNVADKPDLCDFYLGSIVQKGNLKIAISTNGKSPTVAKRLREVFTELIPNELNEVLTNLQTIRNTLKGDFADKVAKLNELTKTLTGKDHLN